MNEEDIEAKTGAASGPYPEGVDLFAMRSHVVSTTATSAEGLPEVCQSVLEQGKGPPHSYGSAKGCQEASVQKTS